MYHSTNPKLKLQQALTIAARAKTGSCPHLIEASHRCYWVTIQEFESLLEQAALADGLTIDEIQSVKAGGQ